MKAHGRRKAFENPHWGEGGEGAPEKGSEKFEKKFDVPVLVHEFRYPQTPSDADV